MTLTVIHVKFFIHTLAETDSKVASTLKAILVLSESSVVLGVNVKFPYVDFFL